MATPKTAKPQQPTIVKEKVVKESAETAEVKTTEVKVVDEDAKAVATEVAPEKQTSEISAENTPEGKFCIVLASNVSRKNADRYVETLHQRGFAQARVYNNGKMNRVIIDGFQTEEEATKKNIELHHTSSEYASTWVLAL